jgi:hypothetical protein
MEPKIPEGCIHSKFTWGCPACTYRWLKKNDYIQPSKFFDHYSGLNRKREKK